MLAHAGIASRRRAEQLIREGRVAVNGTVITELGSKADAERDHIKVDGKHIHAPEKPVYLLMNKPKNVVTSVSDPEGRPTVMDLLRGVKARVYPVGRLDYHSEGLAVAYQRWRICEANYGCGDPRGQDLCRQSEWSAEPHSRGKVSRGRGAKWQENCARVA